MNTLQIVKSNVRATTDAGVVVSVIAWKAGSTIGFDRYHSASAADRIMQFCRERDAEYPSDVAKVRTQHVRLEVAVSSIDAADQEINAHLEELFEQASAEALH